MSGEGSVVYQPGSIGASQAEIAKILINGDEIINELILRLQGVMILYDEKGNPYEKRIEIPQEQQYKEQTLLWFKTQMQTVVSKSMTLSNLRTEEMYLMGETMALNFDKELWQSWRMYLSDDFEIAINQYAELCGLHSNFLDSMLRHPLDTGIRDLLGNIHTEQTQNLRSEVRELTEKKGGIFGTGLLK